MECWTDNGGVPGAEEVGLKWTNGPVN